MSCFHLSPRQRQVLWLLSKGLTCREIASVLRIGVPMVSRHVRVLKDKLGASTLSGVVYCAFRLGLIGFEDGRVRDFDLGEVKHGDK